MYVDHEPIQTVSCNKLFDKCNAYRIKQRISADTHVILLTELSNEHNWFAGSDPSGKLNHFIQTSDREYYIDCDPRFPIAYEVVSTLLRRLMFSDYKTLGTAVHKEPRGCMNDFCGEKAQIDLKLRTGDICSNCMQYIDLQNIDPRLVAQVLDTIDRIRTQMLFRERFRQIKKPSRISIRGNTKKIFFKDLADIELKLTPLEKTIYLLFLKEENGLLLNELHEHANWIRETYKAVGNPRTVVEMNNSINQLTDSTENSTSEKLSKIKTKIIDAVGKELAPHYIIEGPRGGRKKITLDRNLVIWE